MISGVKMKLFWRMLFFAVPCVLAAIPVAGDDTRVMTGSEMTQALHDQIQDVHTSELQQMLTTNPDLVLVDIRMPNEVESMGGTIDAPNNLNIPRGWLEFRLPKQVEDPGQPIVVYCGGNIRSGLAAVTLQEMGYRHVYNYADGFLGWKKQGLPIKQP